MRAEAVVIFNEMCFNSVLPTLFRVMQPKHNGGDDAATLRWQLPGMGGGGGAPDEGGGGGGGGGGGTSCTVSVHGAGFDSTTGSTFAFASSSWSLLKSGAKMSLVFSQYLSPTIDSKNISLNYFFTYFSYSSRQDAKCDVTVFLNALYSQAGL